MIGKVLKKMRNDAKYTQKQLSKILSINQTTLSGWERGYREPTFDLIERIAAICDYEINFTNKTTKEVINTSNIHRKEI